MPSNFILANQSPTGIAYHEAGHLIFAWIYRVPYLSATITPNRPGTLGLVSDGGRLAPCPLDINITGIAERTQLVRALTGESYILMAGLVSELHQAGVLVEELLLPDTSDPQEDTSLVRTNIRAMRWIAQRQEADLQEQEHVQHDFQYRVARIVRTQIIWKLITDVARMLLERQTIHLADYAPLLEPHEANPELEAIRAELGIDPTGQSIQPPGSQ